MYIGGGDSNDDVVELMILVGLKLMVVMMTLTVMMVTFKLMVMMN